LSVDAYFASAESDNIKALALAPVNESLKTAIYRLADSVTFPFQNIYVHFSSVDVNAIFMGISKVRVVILHRLISLLDVQQVVAVVAHELGHWKHGDLIIGTIVSVIEVVLQGLMFRYVSGVDLREMGFQGGIRPLAVVLFIVQFLMDSMIVVETPIVNSFARGFEKRADCFAAGLGYPIQSSLVRLADLTMEQGEASRLYELFYYDRPVFSQRIMNIQKCTLN
jgi:STE24 endopeptidase